MEDKGYMYNMRKYIRKLFNRNSKVNKGNGTIRETISQMDKIVSHLNEEISNLESAISEVSEKSNSTDIPIILNNFLFFRVTFKDIVLSTQLLLEEENEQKKNLLLRSLVLHIYEFLDDTKDFLGKKFRADLKEISDYDFHLQELNLLKRYYELIKKLKFKELSDIRHSVIAHKDQNSIVLNNKIKEIDHIDIDSSWLLIFLLFALIIRFQKNMLISIKNDYKKKRGDESVSDNKFISIKRVFDHFTMLFSGIPFSILALLENLPPDVYAKFMELVRNSNEEDATTEFLNNLTSDELMKFYQAIKIYERSK